MVMPSTCVYSFENKCYVLWVQDIADQNKRKGVTGCRMKSGISLSRL